MFSVLSQEDATDNISATSITTTLPTTEAGHSKTSDKTQLPPKKRPRGASLDAESRESERLKRARLAHPLTETPFPVELSSAQEPSILHSSGEAMIQLGTIFGQGMYTDAAAGQLGHGGPTGAEAAVILGPEGVSL